MRHRLIYDFECLFRFLITHLKLLDAGSGVGVWRGTGNWVKAKANASLGSEPEFVGNMRRGLADSWLSG